MTDDERSETRRNRSGAATRARIVESAIMVMAERGFSAITLQGVADRAGIRYGNLTHHYPTRDRLVEALLDALLQRYRDRFAELAVAFAAEPGDSLGDVIGWLLDDAVQVETGPVFLELWAMTNHQPEIAAAMQRLYDEAVRACILALGVSMPAAKRSGLRDALYLLGTVLEGSSAIFSSRPRETDVYRGFRDEAFGLLVTALDARLASARAIDREAH